VNLPGVDFGRLTLRTFDGLQEEWLEEQRRRDWRAYVTYRAMGGKSQPGAVFGSLKTRRAPKPQKPQQIMAAFKAMFGGPPNG
jgi:hypothetical protein